MFKANQHCIRVVSVEREVTGWQGFGASHKWLASGLVAGTTRTRSNVLKVHLPFHESDHCSNIAFNGIVSAGTGLEDIELLTKRPRCLWMSSSALSGSRTRRARDFCLD